MSGYAIATSQRFIPEVGTKACKLCSKSWLQHSTWTIMPSEKHYALKLDNLIEYILWHIYVNCCFKDLQAIVALMKIEVNRHTCTYSVMNKKGGRIQLQISREWSMTVNSLMNALPLNNIIRQDRICRKAFPESEPQAKNGTTIICNFTILYLGWESFQLLSKVWIFMEFSIGHHWSQGVEMKYSVTFLVAFWQASTEWIQMQRFDQLSRSGYCHRIQRWIPWASIFSPSSNISLCNCKFS
jgi:hypothetical protein